MMMSMFSMFDPSSSPMKMTFNWVTLLLVPLILLPSSFWLLTNTPKKTMDTLSKKISTEMKPNLLSTSSSSLLLFIVTFTSILMYNSMGLLPYTFIPTSHMALTFSLALPLWLSFLLFGWIKNTKNMLAHLLPLGTPLNLMIFMVLIETISNVIRPLALALRLMANMVAGHLLMSLLSSQMTFINSVMPFILLSQIFLTTLEVMVSFVQAYVFTMLLILYSAEIK